MGKKSYSQRDVETALREAGLAVGDIVFVTTSLGMLGVAEEAETQDELNALHHRALRAVVGDTGTILVPTYSYTFGRSTASEYAVFDPSQTPAEIGPFPEFFRKQPGVIRSLDPMMSIAGEGPKAESLFADLPPTSYGAGCLFARLVDVETKCCSIGLGPNWTPFIHYADWLAKSPFRYDKLFRGIIAVPGERLGETRSVEMSWIYNVPLLHEASVANGHLLGAMAEEAGIWKYAPLGRARVYLCSYRAYFEFAMRGLAANPWLTAYGPPGDPIALELERVPRRITLPASQGIVDPRKLCSEIASTSRAAVSDASDAALEKIGVILPIEKYSFVTGENHLDWIIPEKWRLESAVLRDETGRVIVEASENHVYAYSLAVNKKLSREQLARHVRRGKKAARPYVDVSTNRDWGLCLTEEEWALIPDGELGIKINPAFSYGALPVGEYYLSGKAHDDVAILSYFDGPAGGRALSGVHAACVLAKALAESPPIRYGVRFLFLSSPAGFAAWLDAHRELILSTEVWIELNDVCGDREIPIRVSGMPAQEFLGPLSSSVPGVVCDHSEERIRSLKSGGNPIAIESVRALRLPFVSLGRADDEGLVPSGESSLEPAEALLQLLHRLLSR